MTESRSTAELGDRHLRQDAGGRLAVFVAANAGRVALVASSEIADTIAGQHCLWMLANLIARQFGLVKELVVAVPAVQLREDVALFGSMPNLAETLAATAQLINPNLQITLLAPESRAQVEFQVRVGQGVDPRVVSESAVDVAGCGWTAGAGDAVQGVPLSSFSDGNPIGPYFAACLGAGEAFKRLRGMRPGKGVFIDSLVVSLWTFGDLASFDDAPAGEDVRGTHIPASYLIGVGAVGQAFVATIAGCGIKGHVTLIDPDLVDATNSNRYPIITPADEGAKKVVLAAELLRRRGLTTLPYFGAWPRFAHDLPHNEQQLHLQKSEAAFQYEVVLSCVDKNVHRHAIQAFWPKLIIGGSTHDLLMKVSAYDMRSPYECLMCANPIELDGVTIEGLASELSALNEAERRRQLTAAGLNVEAVEAYLLSRKCGELGEQELARFANRPAVQDFSVGFVSVASGVVLAAQLVRFAMGGLSAAFPESLGSTLSFSFLRPGTNWSKHRRREGCECNGPGRRNFGLLWGAS